ncbi:hypothetical protein RND71_033502 [Anisodus tanguticus]|uniref:Uncharacterized protein n=1 Tax=Anisodus tanguticus TaxID=243964 RepID=A0AAE1R9J0_9SOLA|nr:hypothetical protein RND71_033502 [Anisodus tanguticus]
MEFLVSLLEQPCRHNSFVVGCVLLRQPAECVNGHCLWADAVDTGCCGPEL